MDINTIVSLFLYIGTFFWGLYLDSPWCKNRISNKYVIFKIWLYIFLCFGYMVGSDWRGYEPEYNAGKDRYISEPISNFLIRDFHEIISDYWLFVGIAKCIYLWTCLFVLKKITPHVSATISLLLNMTLMYMLISNPLRYMIAMIFVNMALSFFIDGYTKHFNIKKVIIIFTLISFSTMSHNASVVYFVIFPLLYFSRKITEMKRKYLLIFYVFVMILTSNISAINEIKDYLNMYLMLHGDFQDYTQYASEDNSSVFLIGNILKVLFFLWVLLSREKVFGSFKYDRLCYSVTILYFFLDRVLLVIPSGFRIAIPLCFFYAVYFVYMIKSYFRLGVLFVMYTFMAFIKVLWSSYVYVPYTNSIYYIITEHISYDERDVYNYNECQKRTGKSFEGDAN